MKHYTSDYLGKDMQDLYRVAKNFVNDIETGTLELDTYRTDMLLHFLKETVNRIDI